MNKNEKLIRHWENWSPELHSQAKVPLSKGENRIYTVLAIGGVAALVCIFLMMALVSK